MNDLVKRVHAAQLSAAETVVNEQLHNSGLCDVMTCPFCRRQQDGESLGTDGPVLEQTLQSRGSIYGDFTNNARIAQELREVVRTGESWRSMTAVQREALDLIILKMSRIVTGNSSDRDSWHDIQGYAKLAEDRCPPATS